MPDSQKLLELLSQGKKLTAMVAPSFPVDFSESQIVYSLHQLGFDRIVDLSLSIATINKMYESLLSKKPSLVIAANCPATVDLVKTKFPELTNNVAQIYSPMVFMSKICQQKFPGYLNIFIGPCLFKKEEAKKYPDSIAIALTYKEIAEVFKIKSIDYKSHQNDSDYQFEDFHDDLLEIFPASGGVKATIYEGGLTHKQVIVCDGPKQLINLFSQLKEGKIDKNIRFLDVLFCKGGCIGGPGIKNKTTLNAYRRRLLEYRQKKGKLPLCSEADIQEINNTTNSDSSL